jgi:prepilin-type N-terminal cleavage/methylation domain-containing protein/uncharacterized repeat protein (TIGR02543 family)
VKLKGDKAFTLVELIVVIAIIAILTAVFIPSFSGFIDRGRFSNDTQSAASMSQILEGHAYLGLSSDYDAHDIRTIINEYHGSEYSFTPEAKDTGFFYLGGSTIIAERYDDAPETIEALLSFRTHTRILSDVLIDAADDIPTPEQSFGAGSYLLTTSGSSVAEVIYTLSSFANQGTSIGQAYTGITNKITSLETNPILRIFGYGVSPKMAEHLENVLNLFHPGRTLFVNNVTWNTTSSSFNDIERIVFAPGISNIPSFNLELGGKMEMDELMLPRSLKTIQADAFPSETAGDTVTSGFSIDQIRMKDDIEIQAEKESFGPGIGQVVFIERLPLIDYSNEIYVIKSDDMVTTDMSNLSIRSQVTGYSLSIRGYVYRVDIHTMNGHVGFAETKPLIINYFANTGAGHDFMTAHVIYVNNISEFPVASRDGSQFSGWWTAPDAGTQITEDSIITTNLDLYARWTS